MILGFKSRPFCALAVCLKRLSVKLLSLCFWQAVCDFVPIKLPLFNLITLDTFVLISGRVKLTSSHHDSSSR